MGELRVCERPRERGESAREREWREGVKNEQKGQREGGGETDMFLHSERLTVNYSIGKRERVRRGVRE